MVDTMLVKAMRGYRQTTALDFSAGDTPAWHIFSCDLAIMCDWEITIQPNVSRSHGYIEDDLVVSHKRFVVRMETPAGFHFHHASIIGMSTVADVITRVMRFWKGIGVVQGMGSPVIAMVRLKAGACGGSLNS
jgi:hypothetical protein